MTERVGVANDLDLDQLTDDAIAELYKGAPERMSEPGPSESPVNEPPVLNIAPAIPPVPDDETVILVNLRFSNECIFISDDSGEWTGDYVQFHEGKTPLRTRLVPKVLAAAPYVYVEPSVGTLYVHPTTKFQTRNPDVWAQYCLDVAANT